jgi:hypothetical protein
MKSRKGNRAIWRTASLILLVLITGGLMVACNLGSPAEQPEVLVQPTTQVPVVGPQNTTPVTQVVIPATATNTPELLPAEKLGPIAVDGTEHRTTEPVTVRVTRGKSVGNVTCSWVLQDANRTGTLGTPTSAGRKHVCRHVHLHT